MENLKRKKESKMEKLKKEGQRIIYKKGKRRKESKTEKYKNKQTKNERKKKPKTYVK